MTLGVGVVGCGNISDIYLTNAPRFRDITVRACADLNPDAAARQARRYGLAARTLETLLASDDVDIILNLTIPSAHAEVSLAALQAGKHVYSEKPLATTVIEGEAILQAARDRSLRVGCSPDTVLGASVQEARRLIDGGAIGRPLTGLASIQSHGMEHWHPNPAFFFKLGGGPVFDMGPYYLSTLVTLLGPVASVVASGQIGFAERTVTTPGSSQLGSTIKVETFTTLQALLQFQAGAQVTFLASWDVWRDSKLIELHGTNGSMRVPDPNWFGGSIEVAVGRADWAPHDQEVHPFAETNWPADKPAFANYRGLGLAEMARAILDGRAARCSGDVALHVLDIMAAILRSSDVGSRVDLTHSCERPAALGSAEAQNLLAEPGTALPGTAASRPAVGRR